MASRASYIRTHGTSYALASLFFGPRLRRDVETLYAFVRIPDDIVDSDLPHATKVSQLTAARRAFVQAYDQYGQYEQHEQHSHNNTPSNQPHDQTLAPYHDISHATAVLWHRYKIPPAYAIAFFDAMEADLHTTRYETYDQLTSYMYGSAVVVGHMMCHLIGVTDETTLGYAAQLGEAMQYTNFLRDIREDYLDYGRIYMPAAILRHYGLSHDDIISACTDSTRSPSPQRDTWMHDQCVHAQSLYDAAAPGISRLPSRSATAVRIASALYAGILQRIAKNNNNPVSHDCHTSRRYKLSITRRTLLRLRSPRTTPRGS